MAAVTSILLLLYALIVQSVARAVWPGSCQSTETADFALRDVDLSGKVVVITGADGNIAGEVCKALARKKASLILACHSLSKCEARKNEILSATGNGNLEIEQIDLSSASSIRNFSKHVIAKHANHIDVLINSAGMYATRMSGDGLVSVMEVNVLGPAFLTDLLLPALRGNANRSLGRVVNVAAATYGTVLPANATPSYLAGLCTKVDPTLDATGGYFALSKFLLTHHAAELAEREHGVVSFAVNPGVALFSHHIPEAIVRFPYPQWLLKLMPAGAVRIHTACTTNMKGVAHCPETLAESAAVVSSAAAWSGIEEYSGSYLDFDTKPLPPDAPQVYGPWTSKDPTCTPREPPPMDKSLRASWYDEMLRLMQHASPGDGPLAPADDVDAGAAVGTQGSLLV